MTAMMIPAMAPPEREPPADSVVSTTSVFDPLPLPEVEPALFSLSGIIGLDSPFVLFPSDTSLGFSDLGGSGSGEGIMTYSPVHRS